MRDKAKDDERHGGDRERNATVVEQENQKASQANRINMPTATTMTANPTTAMNTTTAMTQNSTTSAYWKSVKLCVAKPDGSAEIHHHDGSVERIGADGRAVKPKSAVASGMTGSVTRETAGITPIHQMITAMKCATIALSCLLSLTVKNVRAEENPKQPITEGLVSVIIDDQTGEELARDHGIQPLEVADLDGLLNAVIQGQKPVSLMHIAVDEDSTDNPLARMLFQPYAGGAPPQAPSTNLPLRQLSEEMKRYRLRRTEWQRGLIGYRTQVQGKVEGFIRQITATQLAVSERFDQKLAARNGRDFNRSDIVGSMEMANKLLKGAERPVIVLNTDGNDLPENRDPQRNPLTPEQLDPRVVLIFVNTSRLPEQGVLFRGLRNEVRHANSVKEAMQMMVSMVDPSKPTAEAPKH